VKFLLQCILLFAALSFLSASNAMRTIIKGATREKKGDGTRQRVTASAKVPKDWHAFLTHSENKKELFAFLSQETEHTQVPDGKDIYITSGKFLSNLLF
jgi:maltooligosyltrehalose synthase